MFITGGAEYSQTTILLSVIPKVNKYHLFARAKELIVMSSCELQQ